MNNNNKSHKHDFFPDHIKHSFQMENFKESLSHSSDDNHSEDSSTTSQDWITAYQEGKTKLLVTF